MKTLPKIFIVILIAALSILSATYFFSARFYGNFHCILLDENNNIITENYEITGVTFFNYEYNLAQEQQYAYWSPNSYYKRLYFRRKTGESAKTIIFYNENLHIAYKKTGGSHEINNMGNSLSLQDLQMKLNTNPLLRISLLSSIIFIFLGITLSIKFWIKSKKIKKVMYISVFSVTTSFILFIQFIPPPQYNNNKELPNTYSIDLNSDCQNLICITNNSEQPAEFTFSIDRKFWWDKDSLLNYISSIPVKDTFNTSKFIIQAWKFVYENTFHCYQEYTQTSHENFDCYLINSIGHGLCGNRALLFCNIAEEKGYKTRLYHNPNVHTFSEVFDGKWKMMDVDYGICLCDNNSEILSVEEIQNGTEHKLIRAKEKMSFLSNALTFFIDSPQNLNSGNDYGSENTTNIEYITSKLNFSNILLPANSTITMPIYDSILMEYTAKIFIPQACNQIIRLPLVITHNNAYIFVRTPYSFEYFVSGNNIEITALLNPMLFLNAKNLTIHSTTALNIDVRCQQDSTDIYYILNNFTNDNYGSLRDLDYSDEMNPLDYYSIYPAESILLYKFKKKIAK